MAEDKTLFFSRIREVKQINRGHSTDAGFDFFIPTISHKYAYRVRELNPCVSDLRPDQFSYIIKQHEGVETIFLGPHERLMLPSGIKIKGKPNKAIVAFNKSGVGVKKGLDVLACVIDEPYQGEIHISIVNTSNHMVAIYEGEKIVQGLELLVGYSNLVEVDEKDLFDEETERGEKGFGDGTGTK